MDSAVDANGKTPASEKLGETLLIVGLGLLGGSVALAAREQKLFDRIVALSRPGRPHTAARDRGLIDDYSQDIEEASSKADFILLAQPVEAIRQQLPVVLRHVRPGGIVTDVGSTKRLLVEEAERLSTRGYFVGSHPMAGGHQTGWEHARIDLFKNQTTYLALTERTNYRAAARVARFWSLLGSRIVLTHPRRHDELAALLSHVPHLTAVGLVQLLGESDEDVHLLRLLAGNGFRDSTRIAMGSSQMWSEICKHNSEPIAALLDRLSSKLHGMAVQIRGQRTNDLERQLEEASKLRQKF